MSVHDPEALVKQCELHTASIAYLDSEVKLLRRMVIGNGDVGMDEQVRSTGRKVESIEKQMGLMYKWGRLGLLVLLLLTMSDEGTKLWSTMTKFFVG